MSVNGYIYIYIYIYIFNKIIQTVEGAGGYNLIYRWKFWTKQNFSPGNSAKLETPRPKNKIIGNST